jgi:hypothetical protein
MKNSHSANSCQQNPCIEIDKRIAYHQAGRAAAIYLGNKQKQLPAVYFHIIFKQRERSEQQADRFPRSYGNYTATVEGGHLIQSLPISFAKATRGFTRPQEEEYRCAFEADIMNLLTGSLAEAKFMASHHDKVFNANLANLSVLRFYGGSSDVNVINEYLECLVPHKAGRNQKLIELFLGAFSFINESSIWQAISALAAFIHDEPKDMINCEDVISFLDSHFVEPT